eukprot:CAMPEP_0183485514 /NCGR_PEP_ID=MMETSP0370-20130417/179467_1 /TAXON_ID=268820 /ORGANISM="Peridinium aciculiferum, Strain PAER-2" /LENGTH=407 /DNA_ID=CAMNT_0025678819 /DNA_START=48 /DNA_END=1272 /DNA_ORIENTATION=-
MPFVKFENIAREWRFKWSTDSDNASLIKAQVELDEVLAEVSSIEGVASVQRIVCGGCQDFIVVTKLPEKAFKEWEANAFAPEAAFLEAVKQIPGISAVETQTYTLEEVKMNKKDIKKVQDKKEKEQTTEKKDEKPPVDPVKKRKAVIKEGGKRGVEIEGAADMGGLQFFCTSVDEPEGDIEENPGISAVETQTYTLEEVKLNKKDIKKAQDKKEKEQGEGETKKDEKPPVDPVKKKKAVIKEGGKRGVEIEGAADMGGLQFFCTSVDEPEGDIELLLESVKAMNEKSDPTEEERKGGSGNIGKMVFSAGVDQLAIVAYVAEDKQAECSCQEWMEKVLSLFGGKLISSAKDYSAGVILTDSNNNIFPLKIRESLILEANNFLRKRGLFPEDNSDDDDDMVFGDDDFPS